MNYNDPFVIVTDHGTENQVDLVRLNLEQSFGISGGTYEEIGRREFGVLGRIRGFKQPAVIR